MGENRIDKLEKRVEKLEEKDHAIELDQLKQYRSLEQLIAKAVAEGNKGIYEKLEKLEDRVIVLENKEAQQALAKNKEIWKTVRSVIISVIITFFATILLNNLISIANDNIESKEVNNVQTNK